MRYPKIRKAIFLDRPNRFIAHVLLEEKIQTVHVKNTGRCKELLVQNATVYLEESDNPARKTKYDLIAVEKIVTDENTASQKTILINMDSQAPNKVAAEWIRENKTYFPKLTLLKPEFTLGESRFDFYAEYEAHTACPHKMLIEVKGCTLEKNGVSLFHCASVRLKYLREYYHLYRSEQILKTQKRHLGIAFCYFVLSVCYYAADFYLLIILNAACDLFYIASFIPFNRRHDFMCGNIGEFCRLFGIFLHRMPGKIHSRRFLFKL